MLEPIGVDADEEALYRLLLASRNLTVTELATRSGQTRERVRALLASLGDKGLVTHSAERTPRYSPTPPDAAIEVLILRRRESLEQVRLGIEALQDEFRRSIEGLSANDLVEVVTGQAAVAQRAKQLQLAARSEFLGIDKPPYAASPISNPEELAALERGVRYRVIYDRTSFEYPGKLNEITSSAARGEESRVMVDAPIKLAIADREHALVPLALSVPGDAAALLLHRSALLDALVVFFERLWADASPMDAPGHGELAPEDEELLLLLRAGLKDQAIARQLGVSSRTIQRRVQELLQRFGAGTRFQAGWLASRRASSVEDPDAR